MHNPNFVIATVPHTGTYTLKSLLPLVGEPVQAHHTKGETFGQVLLHHNRMDTTCYVIPLRDPRAVHQSWHQRGESYDQLLDHYRFMDYLMRAAPYVLIPMDIGPPSLDYLMEIFPNCVRTTALVNFLAEWPKLNAQAYIKEPIPTPPSIEALAEWWGYSTLNDSQS